MGHVANDRDIDVDDLVDRGRVDVDMRLFGVRAEFVQTPVIRSSKRAPMLIIRSQSCIAMLASYSPCMPSIPSQLSPDAG